MENIDYRKLTANATKSLDHLNHHFGLSEAGLKLTLAYHCNRCDYQWFPKDFDNPSLNIFDLLPPKSCARCKSRQWDKPRKRKATPIKNPANPSKTYPWVALPRIKALNRNSKRLMAQIQDMKKYLESMKAKQQQLQEQRPVIKIQTRKKKKRNMYS